MAAGTDQDQATRFQTVNQQPVRADVAVAVVPAFSGEGMVCKFFGQRKLATAGDFVIFQFEQNVNE
jgi:hypothetical protein